MKLAKWLILGVLAVSHQAQACLRPSVDERAVQWSTAVVKAKLVSQKASLPVAKAPVDLVVSTWKVTVSLDGALKPGTDITVLTFAFTDPEKPTQACHELPPLDREQLMLLRPAKDCTFAIHPDAAKREGDPYVIVNRLMDEDATQDALDSLKQRIETVRKAEAAFSEKDAKFQAETLANAVDDTEAEHAENALIELGPKVLPAVKELLTKATAAGRNRLQRVIDELSPPPADTGKRPEPAKD